MRPATYQGHAIESGCEGLILGRFLRRQRRNLDAANLNVGSINLMIRETLAFCTLESKRGAFSIVITQRDAVAAP